MAPFSSILVANRGEIALRVIRTARSLGYRTVAVYSEADADAPHVAAADQAVAIGPAPVRESYLDAARIIDAATLAGAEAIHPGYGFLSEQADFARACEATGLTFIGPGAKAIELMGNKAAAKRRMIAAGVPCVPGYEGEDQADDAFRDAAKRIGYPVMVKAAAGGGGRGMRLVERADDLAAALATARSEALNAFGSDELILEKAVVAPRHVEIQVLADRHGRVIHLGERDCSVQRRHQKVIEEAPCPVMTEDLRARMGKAAVEAARSIDYVGAGTVEFLLDADGAFHFLEMNTRLQVEHPVTEMVTGLDLVALQIDVAAGKALGLTQADIRLRGHAIEARLYAEDPAQGFMPATGRIVLWAPPDGDGVRVDAGIVTGQAVSPFYDPMLAKVIAWGADRDAARRRLVDALKRTALFGVTSNLGFLADALQRPRFANGEATTAFLAAEFAGETLARPVPTPDQAAAAAVLLYLAERQRAFELSLNVTPALLDWASAGRLATRYGFEFGDRSFDLLVSPRREGGYVVRHGDDEIAVRVVERAEATVRLDVGDRRLAMLHHAAAPGLIDLCVDGHMLRFRNRLAFPPQAAAPAGRGRIVAPMHGALVQVLVRPGDAVAAGTRLAVLEAMKMQHDIVADVDGTVRAVAASAGSQVGADDLLIEIEVS